MRRNIVYHVTRQYMKMNKKRTVTTLSGIILMVLLMTCVFVGKDTALHYMEQVTSQKDGKWHVSLYDITSKERSEIEELDWVEQSAVSAYYGFTEFKQSANELKPYLNVKAYEPECFDWMNIQLKSGRLPEKNGEIVVSEAALEDGAMLAIGDEIKADYFTRSLYGISQEAESTYFPFYNITLKYAETVEAPQNFPYYAQNDSFKEIHNSTGKQQILTVVGIIETPAFEESASAGYSAITVLGKQEAAVLDTFNLSIKLDLSGTSELYGNILREIAGTHEIAFNDYVLIFSGNSDNTTMNMVVFFMTVFFVVLIIFASVLLIYNMFNMSFEERSRYLGMLSSVGATGKQKRSSVYYEAVSLLCMALPIGFAGGLLVVKLGMKAIQPFLIDVLYLGQYVDNAKVELCISYKAVLLIVIMSVVTVMVSAYLPARKIGKLGPLECIRGNAEGKNRRYRINLTMVKKIGAEGMLAGNTLKRQSKKTRAIMAAAVTFLVIMIVTAFGASAIERVVNYKMGGGDIAGNMDGWDYVFYTLPEADPQEYEAIKTELENDRDVSEVREWYCGMFVGGVSNDTYSEEYWKDVREIYNLYGVEDAEYEELVGKMDEYNGSEINVLAVDEVTLKDIAEKTGTDYEKMKNSDIPSAIVVQSGELSTDNIGFADRKAERYRFYEVEQMTDKQIGENIDVLLYSSEGTEQFPIQIAGYAAKEQLKDYVTFNSQWLWLIVTNETAKKMNTISGDDENPMQISPELYIRTKSENPEIIEKLKGSTDDIEAPYGLAECDFAKTLQEAILGIVRILLICFVLLVSVICLLNVSNSIRNRISGRSKEFAIMESMGMTEKQTQKMLFYESIGIVVKSILYAAIIAAPLIYLIQYGLTRIFGHIALKLPWLLMLLAIVLAALVVTMFTRHCYHKGKQRNIIDFIRND